MKHDATVFEHVGVIRHFQVRWTFCSTIKIVTPMLAQFEGFEQL